MFQTMFQNIQLKRCSITIILLIRLKMQDPCEVMKSFIAGVGRSRKARKWRGEQQSSSETCIAYTRRHSDISLDRRGSIAAHREGTVRPWEVYRRVGDAAPLRHRWVRSVDSSPSRTRQVWSADARGLGRCFDTLISIINCDHQLIL